MQAVVTLMQYSHTLESVGLLFQTASQQQIKLGHQTWHTGWPQPQHITLWFGAKKVTE